MSLSNKQLAFVNEYLVDFNATQAAIRAGYSEKTAYSIGWENLRKPEIIEAIRDKSMSAEEVLMRLSDIARGDMADLMEITSAGFTFRLMVDENGQRIVNPKTKLIKKIKQKVTISLSKKEDDDDHEVIETELELYSAHEALRDIGRYHKLFTDKTEITGKDGKDLIPDMGVKAIDYRTDLAALAPGSIPDSDPSSQSQDTGDGPQVG